MQFDNNIYSECCRENLILIRSPSGTIGYMKLKSNFINFILKEGW
jgi:hypothetical protein